MDDKLNKVREALGLVIRTGSNLHAEGGISGWDAFEAACEKADKLFSTIDAEPVERVTPSMRDILHDMRNIAEESGKHLDEVRKKYGLDAEPVASSAQAEPLKWQFTGIGGLKRYLTEKQYQAQTPAVKKWYAPICDRCGPTARPSQQPAQAQTIVSWRMVVPGSGKIIYIEDESEAKRFKSMDGREVRPMIFADSVVPNPAQAQVVPEGCNFVWAEIGAGNFREGLDKAIDKAIAAQQGKGGGA